MMKLTLIRFENTPETPEQEQGNENDPPVVQNVAMTPDQLATIVATAIQAAEKQRVSAPASNQPVANPKPSMKLDFQPFDGKDMTITNVFPFLGRFEDGVTHYQFQSDEEKIKYMVHHFGSDARMWWRTSEESLGKLTWSEFQRAFKERFLPPGYQQVAIEKMHGVKQTGSVQDYIQDFRTLLGQIKKDYYSETQVKNNFLRGLKPQIRASVVVSLTGCSADLARVEQMALGFEEAVKGTNMMMIAREAPVTAPAPVAETYFADPEPMDLDAFDGPTRGSYYGRGGLNRGSYRGNRGGYRGTRGGWRGGFNGFNRPRFNPECCSCGERGHFARNCYHNFEQNSLMPVIP
ncbi:unnamed protein product [Ambrosiozyma monospora]|uniref:Unnamed protein product n=1 Tax=Ambrosiozyma monospora TaxID=43982 RepID=A0ACB5SYU1_AMBMO|nr:unnamed protein product [Ambrosiozyma monospora]